MISAGIREARQRFTEFLAKVENGEEVIITRHDEPVARISAFRKRARRRLASRRATRDSIGARGTPLSSLVIAERREGHR